MLAATLFVDPSVSPNGSVFATISAAVAAAHSGDTIKVVPGSYNESIIVDKPLTLIGGQLRVPTQTPGASTVTAGFGIAFDLMADNITVKNFAVNDTLIAIGTRDSFSGYHIVSNTFTDDHVGIILETLPGIAAKPTTISRNRFVNANNPGGADSILANGSQGIRNVTISNNTFVAHNSDATISINCTGQSANVQILNNRILQNRLSYGEAGIIVANTAGSKIDGNSFIATGFGIAGVIHLAGGVTNTEVADNSLLQVDTNGILLDQSLVAVSDSNNRILNNSITSFSARGIVLSGAMNNKLSGNLIWNSRTDGISLTNSDSNVLSNNSSSANGQDGIRLQNCSFNTLSKNTANHNALNYGIDIRGSGTGNTLVGNVTNYNASSGIIVNGSGDKLTGNVANFNNSGIQVSGNSNMIASNTVKYNFVGLFVFGDANIITKNSAMHNADGFELQGQSNSMIGNMANRNQESGFAITGGMNTIKSNIANFNTFDGFVVGNVGQTSNCTITGNIAQHNGNNGIDLSFLATGNAITGNTAMDNGDGMLFFDLFDGSTGMGTAGTANTWAGNKALTRSPSGLL